MTKIWALFSVENNYDQPDNNLVAWWTDKPSFDILAKAVGLAGFPCDSNDMTLYIVNLWQGIEGQIRQGETLYRLKEIKEGKL